MPSTVTKDAGRLVGCSKCRVRKQQSSCHRRLWMPKLGSAETPLTWDRRRGWLQDTRPSPHVKFGSSVTKGLRISKRKPPKLWSAGTPPGMCYHVKFEGNLQNWEHLGPAHLRYGHRWPRRNTPLPTCVILPKFVVLCQTIRALLRRSTWKKWSLVSCLSRSLKVIGNYTDWYAVDDFLLTNMSLSCAVCEINGDFSRKSQNFPTAVQAFDCDAVIYNRLWQYVLRSLAFFTYYSLMNIEV